MIESTEVEELPREPAPPAAPRRGEPRRPEGVREDVHQRFLRVWRTALEREKFQQAMMWPARSPRDPDGDGSWDNSARLQEEDP